MPVCPRIAQEVPVKWVNGPPDNAKYPGMPCARADQGPVRARSGTARSRRYTYGRRIYMGNSQLAVTWYINRGMGAPNRVRALPLTAVSTLSRLEFPATAHYFRQITPTFALVPFFPSDDTAPRLGTT